MKRLHINEIKRKFEVWEDNGGNLYLVIFDKAENPVYVHVGYERRGQLTEDLCALAEGSDPDDWDGNEKSPAAVYEDLLTYEFTGTEKVVDNNDFYPEKMGLAAMSEFGLVNYWDNIDGLSE